MVNTLSIGLVSSANYISVSESFPIAYFLPPVGCPNRINSFCGAGEIPRISIEGLCVSRILCSGYTNLSGLVAYTQPTPEVFLTNVRNDVLPEVENFALAALGVILVSLLLKGFMS